MKSETILSVVIPVYNCETKIQRCLESILNQTFKNFEVIIINDGSTDKTIEIINKMQLDSRFIIFDKQNGGVSSARNFGILKSTGKFITFIDSDDYIEQNHFEIIVDKIIEQKCDVLITTYQELSNNGTRKISLQESNSNKVYKLEDIINILKEKNMLNQPWNKVFRRDKISNLFDDSLSIGEDLIFLLKNINSASTFSLVDSKSYFYDTTSDLSLTKNYILYFNTFVKLTHITLNEFKRIMPKYSEKALDYSITDLFHYLFTAANENKLNGESYYKYLCDNTNIVPYLKTLKLSSKKVKLYTRLICSKSYFILYTFFLLRTKFR